jgi:hypothetical protein
MQEERPEWVSADQWSTGPDLRSAVKTIASVPQVSVLGVQTSWRVEGQLICLTLSQGDLSFEKSCPAYRFATFGTKTAKALAFVRSFVLESYKEFLSQEFSKLEQNDALGKSLERRHSRFP